MWNVTIYKLNSRKQQKMIKWASFDNRQDAFDYIGERPPVPHSTDMKKGVEYHDLQLQNYSVIE